MDLIRSLIGDRTDDDALSIIEDFTDSLDDSDNENWRERYEQNDADWRKRYQERFFSGRDSENTPANNPESSENNPTYDYTNYNPETVTLDDLVVDEEESPTL